MKTARRVLQRPHAVHLVPPHVVDFPPHTPQTFEGTRYILSEEGEVDAAVGAVVNEIGMEREILCPPMLQHEEAGGREE